jgi:hypothetical protein
LFAAPLPDAYSVHGFEAKRLADPKGWAWMAPAELRSVEVQPDGRLLFAGGPFGVMALKEVKGLYQVEWDWESLGLQAGDIAYAVAAERDPYGRPNLILAAQPDKKRVFLAEARSRQVKIRWQYALSLPPRVVRLCPDTGVFLVLSSAEVGGAPWRLEEVDFRQDKTVWGFGDGQGSLRPLDALRLKNGWTLLSDAASGRLAAFDRGGKMVWVQTLATAPALPLRQCPIALERRGTRGSVLVAPTGADGKTQWVRVATETGKVLERWTSVPQGGVEIPIPSTDALSVVIRARAAAP